MSLRTTAAFHAAALAFFLAGPVLAGDWPMFRGPDRNGISTETRAPLEWSSDKNVKWKSPLPQPGNSSPIVVGDRVFVTCANDRQGTKRSLFCFNRADGKELWVKTVKYDAIEKTYPENPYCGASPATDGKIVLAWHGSAGLYCYDVDGKELWSRDLGVYSHIWGWAASPIIHGGTIFLNCGPGVRQGVVAIEKSSGKILWETEEPGGADDKSPETKNWLGSWSTPIVTSIEVKPTTSGLRANADQLLVFMQNRVKSYDPKTGKVLWWIDGAGPLAYTDLLLSPRRDDGRIGVAMAGYGGAAIGFKLADGSGDLTATNRLWRDATKPPQRIGSGVIIGDYIYMTNEPSLACYELQTGKEVWKESPRDKFWAPLLNIGDRLYAISKSGTTYVFAADSARYRELAKNPLGEPCNSSPAISNGELFIRTAGHLWCIKEK